MVSSHEPQHFHLTTVQHLNYTPSPSDRSPKTYTHQHKSEKVRYNYLQKHHYEKIAYANWHVLIHSKTTSDLNNTQCVVTQKHYYLRM